MYGFKLSFLLRVNEIDLVVEISDSRIVYLLFSKILVVFLKNFCVLKIMIKVFRQYWGLCVVLVIYFIWRDGISIINVSSLNQLRYIFGRYRLNMIKNGCGLLIDIILNYINFCI